MNTQPLKLSSRRTLWPCALLLLSPALSGCGGGGGSAPTTMTAAQVAHITLSGTLLDVNSAPLAGYRVVYAPAAATAHARHAEATGDQLSAVTNSLGQYSLSISVSEATPNATFTVYDTTGALVQSQAITLDPSETVQTMTTTIPAGATTTSGTATAGSPPPLPPLSR